MTNGTSGDVNNINVMAANWRRPSRSRTSRCGKWRTWWEDVMRAHESVKFSGLRNAARGDRRVEAEGAQATAEMVGASEEDHERRDQAKGLEEP